MFQIATKMVAVTLLVGNLWAGSAASVNRAATLNLSDAQIERDIRARLARSPKLSVDKFTVKVQGGIATFDGKTNVIQHKGTATRMAKTAGAKAVVNNIQISDAARRVAAARLAERRGKPAGVKTAAASAAGPATGVTRASVVH